MGTCRSSGVLCIILFLLLIPLARAWASPQPPPTLLTKHFQTLKQHAFEVNSRYQTCKTLAARRKTGGRIESDPPAAHAEFVKAVFSLRQELSAFSSELGVLSESLKDFGADTVFTTRLKHLQRRLDTAIAQLKERSSTEVFENLLSGSLFKKHNKIQKEMQEQPIEKTAPIKQPVSFEEDHPIATETAENQKSMGFAPAGSKPFPTADDLSEDGLDVVFTESIKNLADTLHHDPIEIYEYVRNNVYYQPYWGSLKGARGVLAEGSGNDADTASLLIALLRCSGYPARYAEAVVTLDIERAKNWLGLHDNKQVGYYLSSADIPDVEELYRGTEIVQIRFRHIFVEAYLPYGDYRGQQRSDLHRLWVPLAPAFKAMLHREGKTKDGAPPFDASAFLEELSTTATVNQDGSFSGYDTSVVAAALDRYGQALAEFIAQQDPQMTVREFFGYSEIAKRQDPILPITLPFESSRVTRYSILPELMHHRIKIQLSYWGTDLDADEEEGGLGTQEIRYMAPIAAVIGRRLTLSYRPATPADEVLLQHYDGNLFGTPCFLVHMYPQLTLDGVIVAENEHKEREGDIDNAAISLGMDEHIRIELYKPGEVVFPQRRTDTMVTVGDFMGIVLDCGRIAQEYLDQSMQRLTSAISDQAAPVERMIGEQLFMTGAAYFHQLDAYADILAHQADVRWFRNPSELTVSRHLQVSWLVDYFPVSIESTTILLDVTGNRMQALPRGENQWEAREAFLRSAMMYLSVMEHTILMELYHQNAVSAVSLLQTALDQSIPVYQITPKNQTSILPLLDLSQDARDVVERELQLGQIVIVPKTLLTVQNYTGAPIISLTPPGNPMGAYREGYFITRCKPAPYLLNPANGGQITEAITDILNDMIIPDHKDWLLFQTTAQGALQNVITNSDAIRDGTLPVRSFLSSAAGIAMSLHMAQLQTLSSAMLLPGCGMMSLGLHSTGEFLKNTLVMYIDFEGNALYCPEQNNGVRTTKYVVMDILGQPKAGYQPSGTITYEIKKPLEPITPSSADGSGTFTFSYDNNTRFAPGDLLEVTLTLPLPEGLQATTRGTFRVNGLDLDIDSNNNQWLQDPARSIEEERIEDREGSSDYPGKVIPLNDGDRDADGVPDFADGMNIFGNEGTDAGGRLVPLILEIPESADPFKTELRFTYNQSDPAQVLRTGEGTPESPYRFTPAAGRLRIWTCDGMHSRNVTEVGSGAGNFVKSGTVYTAAELGSGHRMRFFVEGVSPSQSPGDETIVVQSRQKGSPEGWNMRDEVRVSVLAIGIDPDDNRDGKIDEADRGRVSDKKPWRFWINNDDDGDADPVRGVNDDLNDQLGLAVPDDLPGQNEDNRDDQVNGIRDLVDFFPLRFRLQQALDFFPLSHFCYTLEHQAGAIGVLSDYAVPDDSASLYLEDPDEAVKLYKQKVQTIGTKSKGWVIPESVLAAMQEDEHREVLLFEARALSDKPLRLSIRRKSDDATVFMQEFPLELLDVREMYFHANFRNVGCPSGKDCGGEIERLEHIKKPHCMTDNSTALVWVHGYNVSGSAATATFAEVFKRLFHAGFEGNFYGLSWYSDLPVPFTTKPLPPHYHQAVVNAFNMAEPFADFIQEIVRRDNTRVSVAAHSLGNVIVGTAVQDYGLSLDNYFAIDAAVALEAYGQNYDDKQSMIKVDKWKSYYDYDCWYDNATGQKKLFASEWHTLFEGTSDNRRLLTWRNRFKNVVSSNMYNFYSSTEEVLAKYDGDNMIFDGSWSSFADKAWVKQEKFKGRTEELSLNVGGVGSPFAGWRFNLTEPAYTTIKGPAEGFLNTTIVQKSPYELKSLSDSFIQGLKTKPFFYPEPRELFNENTGSDFVMRNVGQTSLRDYYTDINAPNVLVRDWLLSEAFPATSLPMGAHINKQLPGYITRNNDMSSTDDDGMITDGVLCKWPRSIDDYNKWYHSDYKDVSYQHVHKFYTKIVRISQ